MCDLDCAVLRWARAKNHGPDVLGERLLHLYSRSDEKLIREYIRNQEKLDRYEDGQMNLLFDWAAFPVTFGWLYNNSFERTNQATDFTSGS